MTRPSGSDPDGLVVVDKPAGWTSHDVVARMRRVMGTRRVGHAGTLDPMATGVLVLGVGRCTKLLTYVVGADKTYLATIRLGISTVTDDAEGDALESPGVGVIPADALDEAIARLTGDIQQVPSSVSAIKVNGVRSYARVRGGEDVQLPSRPVTVSEFVVFESRSGQSEDGVAVLDVDVRVTCSSGTYIRALARDLGDDLGVGGHLTALRRTRVGGFDLRSAVPAELLIDRDTVHPTPDLLSAAEAASRVLPVREVSQEEATNLSHGRWLTPSGDAEPVAALSNEGELLAVLRDEDRRGETLARPILVFSTPGRD